MSGKRVLARTPSTAEELHPFQRTLLEEVGKLFEACQQDRTPMLTIMQQYEQKNMGTDNKERFLGDHAKVIEAAFGGDEADAQVQAAELYAPRGEVTGVHGGFAPCIFSYKDESMWRKAPANPVVMKLAKSIISTGFRATSVIESRTLVINDEVRFSLLLGDGSARALAAGLVWTLLVKHVSAIPCQTEPVQSMVTSLLNINVNFEAHGDGSGQQALVVQAVRQAQAAAVLPCNTLHWVGMAIQYTGQKIGEHSRSTATLERSLEAMVKSYNDRPEVAAYEESAMPNRKRRKGAKNVVVDDDADRDKGLRIGRRRLTAMRNLLAGSTEVGAQHLLFFPVVIWTRLCPGHLGLTRPPPIIALVVSPLRTPNPCAMSTSTQGSWACNCCPMG